MKARSLILLTVVCGFFAGCTHTCTQKEQEPVAVDKRCDNASALFTDGDSILRVHGMTQDQFIALSTDSAWNLPAREWEWLKSVRNSIPHPDPGTLLQKVIPIENIPDFVSGKYSIRGYVSRYFDVKSLKTMHDVYWGFRLDYEGSPFSETGSYGIILFRTKDAFALTIPYFSMSCNNVDTRWPCGGGGFTTSALGCGGFPEWTFNATQAVPDYGAKLHQVDNSGKWTLSYVYDGSQWLAYPPDANERKTSLRSAASANKKILNGVVDGKLIASYGNYKGRSFFIQEETEDQYELLSTQFYPEIEGLRVIEKGLYGLTIPHNELTDVHKKVSHPQ